MVIKREKDERSCRAAGARPAENSLEIPSSEAAGTSAISSSWFAALSFGAKLFGSFKPHPPGVMTLNPASRNKEQAARPIPVTHSLSITRTNALSPAEGNRIGRIQDHLYIDDLLFIFIFNKNIIYLFCITG